MKAYYDVHRRQVTFNVGDKVLSTKNLELRPPGVDRAKKLLLKFVGPFTVTAVVSKGAYRLDLPRTMSRLHNVFNVCLLKPHTAPFG
eukprot:165720-Chlamydomonas_euryale.AAC.1